MSTHESTATEIVDLLSKLIHREILKLAILVGIAFVAFFVTRAIAANNRSTALRNAASWYRKGQAQISSGHVGAAVNSFRRARLIDRRSPTYALALARALAVHGDTSAARNTLLALRESSPEDIVLNLELAHLAVARRDVAEAIRYYQNALYGPWPADQADRRRSVRTEMIRFMLSQGDRARAIPELIALSTDMPDEPAAQVGVALLFAQAGDSSRALEQFQRALRREPRNATALAGAARASFAIGNYARAAHYLNRTPPDSAGLAQLRRVVNWVLSGDPLAARISGAERQRRLADAMSYVVARLQLCLADSVPARTRLEPALAAAQQFRRQMNGRRVLSDAMLDAGVDLAHQAEVLLVQDCPPATVRDRAMILIGERHKAEQM